jgi:UDP:flavonoid glycosyltransferase YjiC (YdhE family)
LRVLGLAEWLPAARWQVDVVAALIARVLAEPAYRQRAVALASTMDTTTAATRACAHLEDMVGQPHRLLPDGAP